MMGKIMILTISPGRIRGGTCALNLEKGLRRNKIFWVRKKIVINPFATFPCRGHALPAVPRKRGHTPATL
jgi:hypothetical protein